MTELEEEGDDVGRRGGARREVRSEESPVENLHFLDIEISVAGPRSR